MCRRERQISKQYLIVLIFFQISDTEGTALNNNEALTFGIRIAQYLKTMGLRQDDVVGIVGSNTTYLMPVVLGCLLNCTPFHAINHKNDEGIFNMVLSAPIMILIKVFIYDLQPR